MEPVNRFNLLVAVCCIKIAELLKIEKKAKSIEKVGFIFENDIP